MRVALAQIDPVVAGVRGNVERIKEAASRAEAAGAELVVFPEQCLGGYPALDLWEDPSFIRAANEALRELARFAGQTGLVVGWPEPNPGRRGKAVFNSAALLHKGKVAAVRRKRLLPTYDVFDEARYFEPGGENAVIRFKGRRLGLTVCEDAWAGTPYAGRNLYHADPVREHVRAGADLHVNVSASPYSRGKTALRRRLFSAHARRAKRPVLLCNLAGANDELIFDGSSLVLDGKGRLCGKGKAFGEDLVLVDVDALKPVSDAPMGDVEEVCEALTLGIRDYARKCGFERALVGLSGGIDSAVVGALAARALGAAQVTGVSMPSRYSSQHSKDDAAALARNLGLRYLSVPIDGVFEAYRQAFASVLTGSPESLAEQNVQARIRGNVLMALSNKEGGLLLSTGNKSEMSVGYCTLYGDMSGGLAVLADVPKRTVYDLARWMNREGELIPQSSIDKPPSAELKPDQKDQDDLPEYDVVDAVLEGYIEQRLSADQLVKKGVPRPVVEDLLKRIDRSEYKRRQAPPCLKISPKAFGVGRRMPIARGSYRA